MTILLTLGKKGNVFGRLTGVFEVSFAPSPSLLRILEFMYQFEQLNVPPYA